jgi:hypothetical protein
MSTSQEMYHLVVPLLYGHISLSKRKEEALLRGIWDRVDKQKHRVDIRIAEIGEPHIGLLKRLRHSFAKNTRTPSTDSPRYTITRCPPPHPRRVSSKPSLFAHTHTLTLRTLPSKEMIYRLYDHSLQSTSPVFPNLQRLSLSGEATWQWETDPAYKRGREALTLALAHLGNFKHICVYHSASTTAKDQYLSIHPVDRISLSTSADSRTRAKYVSLGLDCLPRGLETYCFHGIISQRLKMPQKATKVRIWFSPCGCGLQGGDCPDHITLEERKEQVRRILWSCGGVDKVELVHAGRLSKVASDETTFDVIAHMVNGMGGGVAERVKLSQREEVWGCECR